MQAPAKAVLFVLLACGLAVVAFTLLRHDPATAPSAGIGSTGERGATPAAADTLAATEGGAAAPAEGTGSAARRSEVASEAAKIANATSLHVRGRLVSGTRGMAGVKMRYTEADMLGGVAVPLAERKGQETESGADGAFSIAVAARRSGLIRLAGEEFVFADHEDNMLGVKVAEADVDLGDVRLAAAARLGGVVRDRSGSAVAGVEVALTPGKSAQTIPLFARNSTKTDEQGKFRFGALRGSEYTLTTASPHHLPGSLVADVAAGATRDDLVIVLDSGASIVGRVVDDVGQPVAGVSVGAYRTTQPDPSIKMTGLSGSESVKTDAAGEFRLGGIEQEVVTLRAWGKGYRAASQPEVRTGTGNVVITLQRLGSVQGRLVDRAGEGVAGSSVTFSSGGMHGIELRGDGATTGADGSFVLEDVPPGEIALEATGSKHLPVKQSITVHPGEPTTGVRLVAASGASIEAVVVDPNGDVVADALVQVKEAGDQPQGDTHGMTFRSRRVERRIGAGDGNDNVVIDDGSPRVLGEARTGKDGIAHIDGLPSGSVVVTAQHDELAPSTPASLTLADSATAETRLTLRQGGALDLHVVDDDGAALADATVVVRGPDDAGESAETHDVKTDSEGKAHLGALPAGSYSAAIAVPPRPVSFGAAAVVIAGADPNTIEASRVAFPVRSGDTARVQLVQPTLTTLTGTLRDARGPVARGKIEVGARETPEALLGMGGGYSATTDQDGRYTIEGLPPGAYDLRYGRKQQLIAGKMALDVRGEKHMERDLLLNGGVVEVTVLGSDGEPLRGADVLLKPQEQEARPQQTRAVFAMISVNPGGDGQQSMEFGTQQPMVHTDEEGIARIEDVPPGKYALAVEHPRHVTHRVPDIDVVAGGTRSLGTVSLAKGGVIRGKVLDATGGAPMISEVELRKTTGGEPQTTMAMQGSFQFTGLEPGRYELRAHQMGPNRGEFGPMQEVELGAGGAEKVDLQLPR